MIHVREVRALHQDDLKRLVVGYTSDAKYVVTYVDSEALTTFTLRLVKLDQPLVKHYGHLDADTLQRYAQALTTGYSFGAYDDDLLVGILLAEPHGWNNSMWLWEFHVAGAYRRQGLARQLMDALVAKAKGAGVRIIVWETQTTNVPAIRAARRLGFRLESVDISYYTNADYPDGEMAVFMKRRLT